MILVSACLLGEKCRYDGQGNFSEQVEQSLQNQEYLSICPEVAGGLGVPRPPVEIVAGRVLRKDGTDVTAEYEAGVAACLELVKQYPIQKAILKARSPACGCGKIYDGTFSGRLVTGDGLLTQALKKKGIVCKTEEDL